MIVVKVELHSAITGKISSLGEMIINNIGGTQRIGNYRVRSYRKGKCSVQCLKEKSKPLRESNVYNHSRLSISVWNLVKKSLIQLGH